MAKTSPMPADARRHELGLRTIAVFEAVKGFAVLVAGTGFLLLVGRDVQGMAERFVRHLHLNPANRYPRIFVELAGKSSPDRLHWLAAGALVYSILRFAEAVGLWHGRRWAEWFGVATGLIYVPFELRALVGKPGPEPIVALITSLLIVLYLALRLWKGRSKHRTKR